MKQKLLLVIAIAFFSITSSAQHNWYDIGTQTYLATVANGPAVGGTITLGGVTNPNPTGINTTATTNKFEKADYANSYIKISLPNPILAADVASTVIKVKLYFETFADLPNSTIRMYLRNTGNANNNRKNITVNFDAADEGVWKEYTFDFSAVAGDASETFNAEYDEIQFFFNQGAQANPTATYYFDGFSGNVSMEDPEVGQLLSGNSWYYNQATSDFLTVNNQALGVFSASETNPNTSELNTNASVAKFTKEEGVHSSITLDLSSTPITDFTTTKFKIQAYLDQTTSTVLATSNTNIRIGLRNSAIGASTQTVISSTVNIGQKWVEYTFDFSGATQKELTYDTLVILFVSPDTSLAATGFEFYIDALQGPDLSVLSSDEILTDSFKLQISPNPVSNSFQLSDSEDVETIQIYNINGALLKTFTVSNNYDISELVTGVYFAKINTAFGSKTVKIIKK